MKITQNTTMEKVLEHPSSGQILAKYKVPCLNCPMAKYEMGSLKLGDVCKVYGIDLKKLLQELNDVEK